MDILNLFQNFNWVFKKINSELQIYDTKTDRLCDRELNAHNLRVSSLFIYYLLSYNLFDHFCLKQWIKIIS